jgi:hypothetical protein
MHVKDSSNVYNRVNESIKSIKSSHIKSTYFVDVQDVGKNLYK